MRLRDSRDQYGLATRVLHWAVAVLMLSLVPLGWWMVGLSYYDRWYKDALSLHKSLGMLALGLGAAKVGWVLANPRVALGAGLHRYERVAATATHHAFYLLMLAVPITGYLISTSAGDGIAVFGLFEVPAVVKSGKAARDAAIALHYYLSYGVGALACLHAGAALKHHFLERDGTLRRMLW